MTSGKWRPFCLGLNVLIRCQWTHGYIHLVRSLSAIWYMLVTIKALRTLIIKNYKKKCTICRSNDITIKKHTCRECSMFSYCRPMDVPSNLIRCDTFKWHQWVVYVVHCVDIFLLYFFPVSIWPPSLPCVCDVSSYESTRKDVSDIHHTWCVQGGLS